MEVKVKGLVDQEGEQEHQILLLDHYHRAS